jgi:hypothetical protein
VPASRRLDWQLRRDADSDLGCVLDLIQCLPDGRWFDPSSTSPVRGRLAGWPDLLALLPGRTTRIVLAAVHLDHDPTNNRLRNLKSLSQRCHIIHDALYHRAQRWHGVPGGRGVRAWARPRWLSLGGRTDASAAGSEFFEQVAVSGTALGLRFPPTLCTTTPTAGTLQRSVAHTFLAVDFVVYTTLTSTAVAVVWASRAGPGLPQNRNSVREEAK